MINDEVSALVTSLAVARMDCAVGLLFCPSGNSDRRSAGWAANLPTWRVENHWLLDIFWGGRAMTGYHAWVFSFVALIFHVPIFLRGRWSWRMEARIIGMIMLFWVIEDALWFVLNPAFGWSRFSPAHVPWHKHWWGALPADYWLSSVIGILLLVWPYRS